MGKGKKHNPKGAKGPAPQLRARNTRSSKGRLLTDPSSSTSQLTAQLSLLGLYAAPTVGDGNCLFRALSDQLFGSPSRHPELRRDVCAWIERHTARYEPFVEDERGLEAHLRCMRENATYGGHMELSAFAHMTRRDVKVVQPGLVYVIEWAAGGGEAEPSGSGSGSVSGGAERRATRSMSVSTAGPASPAKKLAEGDGVRVKTGRGYYVYEEVSSSDEDDDDDDEVEVEALVTEAPKEESGGPTVYVAYHDWEHFSSIRNLRGPHTGLPEICETPPPDVPTPADPKEREKERERERKKERERKEKERKERERERKALERAEREQNEVTVKLKLPSASQQESDPTMVPLPTSRSASPFVSLDASSTSSLASTFPAPIHPHHNHNHSLLQTPRSSYRSPKRSFDESSASGGEDDGREKRSRRRRVGSRSDADVLPGTHGPPSEEMHIDVENVDGEGGADTPGLSAPGSSSSETSSELSSSSSSASASPEPEPEPARVEQPPTIQPELEHGAEPTGLSKHARQKYLHMHLHGRAVSGDKPLTRRQRKALGLPKARSGGAIVAEGGAVVSAGKIVIPGGRWKGRAAGVGGGGGANTPAVVGVVEGEQDAEGEWRRNGAGRVDVRGFRELKI